MTTDPTQPQPPAPSGDSPAVVAVFRTALRDMTILIVAVTVLGTVVGALVAGVPGVWGALIGAGIALVFSGATALSMLRTARSDMRTMAAVVMGTWLGKVVVVVVVLAILRDMDFYDRGVLAVVVAVGVIGSALLDYRAVSQGRLPYVEPGASRTDGGGDVSAR